LNFSEERILKITNLYAVVPHKGYFYIIDWMLEKWQRIKSKYYKEYYWLGRLIKEYDKPEEEKTKSFDIEVIKENATPDKILGANPVYRSPDKEKYLCPLHNEKTPSFVWNKKEKYFKCFGCGESGDIITLYQKINNCDFRQACRDLQEII